MRVADVPARTVLAQAIAPHFPPKARWQLVEHEGSVDDSQRVRVRITQRSIAHSDTGDPEAHKLTFRITITIPTDLLDDATEAQLDDDMEAFLFALDAGDVPWTTATKGMFADEGDRLGYQLELELRTNSHKPDEEE
jgi:hypothetical protein